MRSNGRKYIRAVNPAYKNKVRRFAPVKAFEPKSRRGIIGCFSLSSAKINPTRQLTPMTRLTTTRTSENPRVFDSTSPRTTPPNPTVARIGPSQSKRSFAAESSRLSGTRNHVINKTAAHNGTFIQNTYRQEKFCTSHPPSTGPTPAATAEIPDHVPIARPRRPFEKFALIRARLPGTSNAAPTP